MSVSELQRCQTFNAVWPNALMNEVMYQVAMGSKINDIEDQWRSNLCDVIMPGSSRRFFKEDCDIFTSIRNLQKFTETLTRRHLIKVDCSLAQFNSSKLRDKEFSIIVPSFFTTLQNE